jgi:type IV pilus assembly protein PilO
MQVSLAKLTWKAQLAVFLAVSVALVGAFYYWWVLPTEAEMAVRRTKLASLRADINRGLATARQLPEFRKQVTEYQSRLESLRAVLPEQKDVGDLLRRIQTLATQSNLQIKGFKPQPIVSKQLHAEWPILLELDGTYHNLGRFFDQVGKFSRIINVSSIHIKAKDKPTADSTIAVDCVATTFVLTEAPAKAGGRPMPNRPIPNRPLPARPQ